MKVLRNIGIITIATAAAIGITACEKQPGPAESAGKSMGQAADDVGRKISAATDKVVTQVENQGSQAGVAMDDTEITTRVKAAIFAEPGLKTLQISVDTVQGVVTLSGSTDSPANSDRAASLARAVTDVKQVDNRLVAMAR
ncbi:MAG: BON domain-containing protein [Rhodocyclaceae bacterium]|nr:BON domain-containing protein [Rhodocyclaceae bacterium]MDZ4214011.1 BON domain-containing protein [Rhodocyclaceae bacterium]